MAFRYWWRRYFGWVPIQFCVWCGKVYWGGFPRWRIHNGKIKLAWLAWWQDFCSKKCCDEDMDQWWEGRG